MRCSSASSETVSPAEVPGLDDLPRLFETCAGCGICRTACPTFVDLFALLERRAAGDGPPDALRKEGPALLDSCFFCGVCEKNCPMGFKIGALAWERKVAAMGANTPPGPLRRRAGLFRSRWVRGLLGRLLDRLAASLPPVRWLVRRYLGLAPEAPLPRLAVFSKNTALFTAALSDGEPRRRIALFAGCHGTSDFPEVVEAAVHVLSYSGCEVQLLGDSCCGLAAYSEGLAPKAIGSWGALETKWKAFGEGWDLVFLSSACARFGCSDLPRLLEKEGTAGRGPHVYELTEYLWELHEKGLLAPPQHPVEGRVAHHASCASKRLGTGEVAVRLLGQIPGLEAARLASDCCGLGGAWGLCRENAARSRQYAESCFAPKLQESEGALVTSECALCRLQAEALVPGTRTVHPVVLYRKSLGF